MDRTPGLVISGVDSTDDDQLSDDLDHWRNNSYPIAFQNHHAGFIITGNDISIDGYGTGCINGNGDAWYTAEKGFVSSISPSPKDSKPSVMILIDASSTQENTRPPH